LNSLYFHLFVCFISTSQLCFRSHYHPLKRDRPFSSLQILHFKKTIAPLNEAIALLHNFNAALIQHLSSQKHRQTEVPTQLERQFRPKQKSPKGR
jgi:hypothetical protein